MRGPWLAFVACLLPLHVAIGQPTEANDEYTRRPDFQASTPAPREPTICRPRRAQSIVCFNPKNAADAFLRYGDNKGKPYPDYVRQQLHDADCIGTTRNPKDMPLVLFSKVGRVATNGGWVRVIMLDMSQYQLPFMWIAVPYLDQACIPAKAVSLKDDGDVPIIDWRSLPAYPRN